jgi:hypothetical protein
MFSNQGIQKIRRPERKYSTYKKIYRDLEKARTMERNSQRKNSQDLYKFIQELEYGALI